MLKWFQNVLKTWDSEIQINDGNKFTYLVKNNQSVEVRSEPWKRRGRFCRKEEREKAPIDGLKRGARMSKPEDEQHIDNEIMLVLDAQFTENKSIISEFLKIN